MKHLIIKDGLSTLITDSYDNLLLSLCPSKERV